MKNISGIIVREQTEQKFHKKFPNFVSWVLLIIGAAALVYYYTMVLQNSATPVSTWTTIGIGLGCTVLSLCAAPTCTPDEYIIDVTPAMSAIEWIKLYKQFDVENIGPLRYRCRRKGWRIL